MRRTVLAAVSVAALLVTAGCAGITDDGSSGLSEAEQIAKDSGTAMEDVETYHMDMQMDLTASGETLTMRQEGVFDRAEQKARLDMNLYGTQGVAYVDGTTMYVNVGDRWQTQDLSDSDPWESGSGLARQQQLLETGEVSVTGSATVDGVQTTVLEVDADPEKLKSLLSQQNTGNMDSVTIESATYKLYVADDTDLPRKVEMTMEMSIQGQTANADVTIEFSEYGEPVTVEIPESAPTASSMRAAA